MNIFQLSKILNEASDTITNSLIKTVQNFNKEVDNHIENLQNAPKKRGRKSDNQKPEYVDKKRDEFLKKVINVTNMEAEQLTGSDSLSKGYRKELFARISNFLAGKTSGSYSNDVVIARDIVSSASDEDIKSILNIPSGKGNHKPVQRTIAKTERINIYDGIDGDLAQRLANFAPGTCGRFEMLLGVLYNGRKITGRENTQGKGDVEIDGKKFEVKKSGTGGVDTGWKQFQYLLNSTVDKSKKMELQKQIKQLKQEEAKNVQILKQSIEKFVKKTFKDIISNKGEGGFENDVQGFADNYFAMMEENDKKRAILYGFYNIGYRNIIVCDDDGQTQFVLQNDIINFVKGSGDISQLGIDITIPDSLNNKNGQVKTADFQKILIRLA